MAWLDQILRQSARADSSPSHVRVRVDKETWVRAAKHLAAGQGTLLGMWGEADAVHIAVHEEQTIGVLSLECANGFFPSFARIHPPALRLERTIRDLYGLDPDGTTDARRWLDHGRWGVRFPLGKSESAPADGDSYRFLTAEGPPMHQIPVGPVHAGIIEPGHFRFTANGETVVRLEERLGYVHKGIEQLMTNAPLERVACLAGRVSGDSTVAYGIAFARAAELALGVEPPARGV